MEKTRKWELSNHRENIQWLNTSPQYELARAMDLLGGEYDNGFQAIKRVSVQ